MRDRIIDSAGAAAGNDDATDWRLAGGRFLGTRCDSDLIFDGVVRAARMAARQKEAIFA